MESQSNVPEVQPGSWRSILVPRITPRIGQRRTWDAAASGVEKSLVVMPTGYGKSIAALGAFLILKSQKVAKRMLILVATDVQRTQWEENAAEDAKSLGGKLRGVVAVSKQAYDVEAARDNKADVFIATYHQIRESDGVPFWKTMAEFGPWFCVYDECHHLREDRAWGAAAKLTSARSLYLSATPLRSDKQPIAGLPTEIGRAHV